HRGARAAASLPSPRTRSKRRVQELSHVATKRHKKHRNMKTTLCLLWLNDSRITWRWFMYIARKAAVGTLLLILLASISAFANTKTRKRDGGPLKRAELMEAKSRLSEMGY